MKNTEFHIIKHPYFQKNNLNLVKFIRRQTNGKHIKKSIVIKKFN
jgi:hypothetical protein